MKFRNEDIYPVLMIVAGIVSLIYVICKIVEWVG